MDQSSLFGAIALVGLAVYGYVRMFRSGGNVGQLKALLPSALIIDVRTSAEYRSGHFSGAVNIPVDRIAKSEKRLGDKTTPIILYCASGSRAKQARRIIKSMGYDQVHIGGSLAGMQRLTA
jgi:phage shock protein E